MIKKYFVVAILGALLVSFFAYHPASAHTTVKAGNTDVEIGWSEEPPVVGQRNAIVVNIAGGKDAPDISGLKVTLTYGPDTQDLTLQPLGEDTPGQYIAPIIPTRAGQYTVTLSGTLGGVAVENAQVQPEEVVTADTIQFPPQASGVRNGAGGFTPPAGTVTRTGFGAGGLFALAPWLSIAALVVGFVAIVLSILAMRRKA
jgi:hypothetical protein